MVWWEENLEKVSKFPISVGKSATRVSFETPFETASDASGVGHYLYCLGDGTTLAARAFTSEEQEQSSTWRELVVIHDTCTNPKVLNFFKGSKVVH